MTFGAAGLPVRISPELLPMPAALPLLKMKKDLYDNQLQKTIAEIDRNLNPKPARWYHIGNRKGKRVYMTESNLRKCDIDDICSDPLLQPVQNRRPRGPRPNRRPPLSSSRWYELLAWLGKSLLEILSGQKK